MNEFIEQFLVEARDLIELATSDLLALEERPDDPERIDSVFRAFHTLKGAAGIVEFEPMGRALHAVESALVGFRSKASTISPTIVDECLACLDQVTRWLDDMEATGEVPSKTGPAADAIVQRFSGTSKPDTSAPPVGDWLARLREGSPSRFSEAHTALRYIPRADAFFRGEDPLALIEGLPGLISIDLALSDPAKPFDTINPFTCAVEILALSNADAETVRRLLGDVGDQIEGPLRRWWTAQCLRSHSVAARAIDPRSSNYAAARARTKRRYRAGGFRWPGVHQCVAACRYCFGGGFDRGRAER